MIGRFKHPVVRVFPRLFATEPSAQLAGLGSSFTLLQNPDDLLFAESAVLHSFVSFRNFVASENLV